jgi:hypothetical protein
VWGHFETDSVATRSFDAGDAAVFSVINNHIHNVGLSMLSDFGAIFVTTRPGGRGQDCGEAYGADACNVLVGENSWTFLRLLRVSSNILSSILGVI